jgi:hypothetical protein
MKVQGAVANAVSNAFDKASAGLRDSLLGPAKNAPKMLSPDEIVKLNPPIKLGPMKSPTSEEQMNQLQKLLLGDDKPPDTAAALKAQRDDLQKQINEVNKFWDDRIDDAKKLRDDLVRNGYKSSAAADAEYAGYVKSYEAQRNETIQGLRRKLDDLQDKPSREVLDVVRKVGYRDQTVADYVRRRAANQAAKEFDTRAQQLYNLMASKVQNKEWTQQKGITWYRNMLDKLEKRIENKYKTIINDVLDK